MEQQRVVAEDTDLEPQIAADLCTRIRPGSRDAEGEMVRRYGAGLLYLLKRRTRDADLALDLRQDTFRVAIEKLRGSALEEPARLAAYLRGVALNLLIAQRRKRVLRVECQAVLSRGGHHSSRSTARTGEAQACISVKGRAISS